MVHGTDKQCSSLYAVDFMFLAFPDWVENGQKVNFQKFRNVIFTYVGYIGFIICGYYMLHNADKQCSSLYAVHFMFVAFPHGVENGQNVIFFKILKCTIYSCRVHRVHYMSLMHAPRCG